MLLISAACEKELVEAEAKRRVLCLLRLCLWAGQAGQGKTRHIFGSAIVGSDRDLSSTSHKEQPSKINMPAGSKRVIAGDDEGEVEEQSPQAKRPRQGCAQPVSLPLT